MSESVFCLRSFVLVTCVLFLPQGYTEECDGLSSGVTLPDPEDCHGYFLCLAGDKLQHYCEPGYIYDENISTCVAGKCPPCSWWSSPLEECEDLSVGQTLQDPEDCHGYFLCHKGEKLPQYCENGLRFDVDVGACVVGKCPPCYNLTSTTTDEPLSSWTPDSSSPSTVQTTEDSSESTTPSLESTTDLPTTGTTEVSSDSPSDTTDDSPESTTPSLESTTDLPTTGTTEVSSDSPSDTTEDSSESTTPSVESTTDLPTTGTTEVSSDSPSVTTDGSPESTTPSLESTTDLPTTGTTEVSSDSPSDTTEDSSESTTPSLESTTNLPTTDSSSLEPSSTTDSSTSWTDESPIDSTPLPSTTTDSSTSSTDPTTTSSSTTDATPSTSTTLAPSVSCDNYRDGSFFSDPSHCQKYYVCQNRKPIQLHCQKGTWFDDVHYVCNFRHLVNCPANID